jgi:hypothetical protein
MKSRRAKRPEPRTELIGLNLTDGHLAQLDQLFAALNSTPSRKRNVRQLTRSTVAYRCFQTGLDHKLEGKPLPYPAAPFDWANRPKQNAKLVGIYLFQTDYAKLIQLDRILERQSWGRSWRRGEEYHPFEFRKPSTLAYRCFQRGLSLLLTQLPSNRNSSAGSRTNAA